MSTVKHERSASGSARVPPAVTRVPRDTHGLRWMFSVGNVLRRVVRDVRGTRGGCAVNGHGYLELTGYAGAVVGLSAPE